MQDETSVKTAAARLIRQPHGGALRAGGKPGNRGGGRLPSYVRVLALQGVSESLPEICAIAAGTKPGTRRSEQVEAWRLLAKVGLGRGIPAAELRARLIHQVQLTRSWAVRNGIAAETLQALLHAQEEAWQ